jgi:hypothetical protein
MTVIKGLKEKYWKSFKKIWERGIIPNRFTVFNGYYFIVLGSIGTNYPHPPCCTIVFLHAW